MLSNIYLNVFIYLLKPRFVFKNASFVNLFKLDRSIKCFFEKLVKITKKKKGQVPSNGVSARKYFAIDCPIGFLAKIKPVLYAHTIYSFSVFRSQNRFRFDCSEIHLKIKCIWTMLVFSTDLRIH